MQRLKIDLCWLNLVYYSKAQENDLRKNTAFLKAIADDPVAGGWVWFGGKIIEVSELR